MYSFSEYPNALPGLINRQKSHLTIMCQLFTSCKEAPAFNLGIPIKAALGQRPYIFIGHVRLPR